jgi:hypothetical protein
MLEPLDVHLDQQVGVDPVAAVGVLDHLQPVTS